MVTNSINETSIKATKLVEKRAYTNMVVLLSDSSHAQKNKNAHGINDDESRVFIKSNSFYMNLGDLHLVHEHRKIHIEALKGIMIWVQP